MRVVGQNTVTCWAPLVQRAIRVGSRSIFPVLMCAVQAATRSTVQSTMPQLLTALVGRWVEIFYVYLESFNDTAADFLHAIESFGVSGRIELSAIAEFAQLIHLLSKYCERIRLPEQSECARPTQRSSTGLQWTGISLQSSKRCNLRQKKQRNCNSLPGGLYLPSVGDFWSFRVLRSRRYIGNVRGWQRDL